MLALILTFFFIFSKEGKLALQLCPFPGEDREADGGGQAADHRSHQPAQHQARLPPRPPRDQDQEPNFQLPPDHEGTRA